MSTQIDWFRKPGETGAGTLNACYNALDRHVVRGRAEQPALRTEDRDWSFSELLGEVGAFAGVLRAFGVQPGARVLVAGLPPLQDAVARLGCARVGAVVVGPGLVDPGAAPEADPVALAVLGTATPDPGPAGIPTVTADGSSQLDWTTVMRAGRAEPAGCADVPADLPLRIDDGVAVPTAAHLAAAAADRTADPLLGPLLAGEPVDLRVRR